MRDDFLRLIFGKWTSNVALSVRENKIALLAILVFLLFSPVYIPRVYTYLNSWDYQAPFLVISKLFNGLTVETRYIFIFLLFITVWVIIITRKMYRSYFEEDFQNHLSKWSIPKGAEWSIVKDEEVPGRTLQVTKAGSPGIFKEARDWYDYTVSFQTKIIQDNFTILVRASDKGNAIMLQFHPSNLRPHLIIEGFFIIDDKNEQNLQIRLPEKTWIDVKIKIQNDYIDVFLEGFRVTYRIPSGSIVVPIERLNPVMSLSELERLNSQFLLMESARNALEKRIAEEGGKKPEKISPRPSYTFTLNFDVGTIGFRESGDERALFRKIKIQKL